MKKKLLSKRIVAMEVLIFFSALTVWLLILGIMEVRNYYYRSEVNKAHAAIVARNAKFSSEYRSGKLERVTDPELIKQLNESPDTPDPEEEKAQKYEQHILYAEEQRRVLVIAAAIIFAIAYIIRFAAIAILWSVRIIRENPQNETA